MLCLLLCYDVWSHAFQRESTAGQEEVEREWARLTSAFMTKWGEVMEESLAAKVMAERRCKYVLCMLPFARGTACW